MNQEFDKAPNSNLSNNGSADGYTCPECHKDNDGNWIECNKCRSWFHYQCVNLNEIEANAIDKYFCKNCENAGLGRTTRKKPQNYHRYDPLIDDKEMKLKTQVGTLKFIQDLKDMKFKTFNCLLMNGDDLTMKLLKSNGFYKPILICKSSNLDMKLPKKFTYQMLIDALGPDHKLEVINVNYQSLESLTLAEFLQLFELEDRPKTYNCISLELSQTELSDQIQPPKIVRKMSWADRVFEKQDRPAVSKYCLLSMKDSYTDFHIDFSGTSVWYHVVKGLKRFFFIEPTPENIDKYENWQRTDDNNEYFLPDIIGRDKCYEYTLEPGDTMLIPAGWIHAVHTPCDSVVFGGNYLQTWGAHLQIRVYEGELRCGFLDKFKFPCFKLTHWCATGFVYKFLKTLCDRGDMNKKSIVENDVHKNLFKSFESFHEFTWKFHEEIEQLSKRLEKCGNNEEEIKMILGDEYRDLQEFEAIRNTYESHNFSTSLRHMKEYLERIRPNIEMITDSNNDEKTSTFLNNLELPQKSVNLNKKKEEEREVPLPKRAKLNCDQSTNSKKEPSVDDTIPARQESFLYGMKLPRVFEESRQKINSKNDLQKECSKQLRQKEYYESSNKSKNLPISRSLHLISPNKNGKHLYDNRKTANSLVSSPQKIFIPSNFMESNSLKNFKIPKKSKQTESKSSNAEDQSINCSNQPTEEDWIDD